MIVMSARRDASFYARPNTRSAKVCHVVVGDSRAACGVPLLLDVEEDARDVPQPSRCRRRGCAERWPPVRAKEDDTMERCKVRFKDGSWREFPHEVRPGGSYTKTVSYEGGVVVIADEWGRRTAFPLQDVAEVIEETERR